MSVCVFMCLHICVRVFAFVCEKAVQLIKQQLVIIQFSSTCASSLIIINTQKCNLELFPNNSTIS